MNVTEAISMMVYDDSRNITKSQH